jgi:hypothetical protein
MKKHLTFSLALLTFICSTIHAQLPSYLPADGLVGWWPFNGNANDESGNGNDGVNPIGSFGVNRFGIPNASFFSDGTGQYPGNGMSIAALNNFPFGNSNRSICVWFKCSLPYPGGDRHLFSYGDNIFGTRFSVYLKATAIGVEYTNGAVLSNYIPDDNWHQIVATYNGNGSAGIDLFLDGQHISGNVLNPTNSLNTLNSFIKTIGRLNDANNFVGSYDDIAIYDRVLTLQEIQNLYAGTNETVDNDHDSAPLPQGIPYQAAARDVQGQIIADAPVNVRFSLHEVAVDGAVSYSETHALTTNSIGLFNTVFGNGTPEQSAFDSINWAATTKFLQVEIDLGDGYVDMGTTQLLSVPYAFRSDEAARIKNAGLPIFADNAAALAGGLVAGEMYRTAAGDLKVVY